MIVLIPFSFVWRFQRRTPTSLDLERQGLIKCHKDIGQLQTHIDKTVSAHFAAAAVVVSMYPLFSGIKHQARVADWLSLKEHRAIDWRFAPYLEIAYVARLSLGPQRT